jgi:peptidoglycan/LPS O-acetylase OafA/YrhL
VSTDRTAAPARSFRLPALLAESDELLHLDALRLIAAVGVIFVHLAEKFGEQGHGALGRLAGSLNLFVDLLFVISGFVISWVYGDRIRGRSDYARFMQRRVARLAPLHWLILEGFVALEVLSQLLSGRGEQSFACFWPNVLFLHATGICSGPSFNYASWSISAEMVMYLLFPGFLLLVRDWRAGLFAAAALALALSAVSVWTGHRPWWEWTFDFGMFRAAPGFLFGMVLSQVRPRLRQVPFARILVWVALALFFAAAAAGLPKGAMLLPLIYLVGVLGFAADLQGPSRVARALGPGGQLTYSIYMWHAFLLALVTSSSVQALLGHPAGAAYRLWVSGLMLLIFPISYLSLFLFEQPARRWLGTRRRPGQKGFVPRPSAAAPTD